MYAQVFYQDLFQFCKTFEKHFTKNTIVSINGKLGSGKTTFIQHCYPGLNVSSPSFLKAIDYGNMLHIDAYTLNNKQDFFNLNIEDVLQNKVVIIEWGDLFKKEIEMFNAKLITMYLERENDLLKIEYFINS